MPFVSKSANFLGAWSIERRPEARAAPRHCHHPPARLCGRRGSIAEAGEVRESEPHVDEALAIAHGLAREEYARFVALIGRIPTFTELGNRRKDFESY